MSLVPGQRIQMPRFILWVIWFAMTQSVILYGVVLKLAKERPPAAEFDPNEPNLKLIFSIISIVLLVIAFAIRFTILQRKPALSPSIYIVILALVEVPAIFGLLLGLQGTPLNELYYFFGMSLLGLVALSPAVIPKPEST